MPFDFDDSEFRRGMNRAEETTKKAAGRAAFAAAEALRGDSVNIVPFDQGFFGGLASTARTSNPKNTPSGAESDVTYNKEYAVRVHEDMTLRINQKRTINGQRRQQKYLEKPMRENTEKYGKIMAEIFYDSLNG
jgi:hypothetical protein